MSDLIHNHIFSKFYDIDTSDIHGKGIICCLPIVTGQIIGLAINNKQITNDLGKWINHSKEPNSKLIEKEPNKYYLIATKHIEPTEEIVADYNDTPYFIAGTKDLGILEHFPPNPDQVVLKNKFYPNGLTEKDIYQYYQSVKPKLLNWINKRNSNFFLRINNDIVVKRKHQNKPIKLSNSNFDQLITGRTNSIYVTIPERTSYFVIDIDGGKGINYMQLLDASEVAINALSELGVVIWEKLFTSPNGMHLIGHLLSTISINSLRKEISLLLRTKQDRYLVNVKGRKPGTINFDLSPNQRNGMHMARYSLTKEGLICDNIAEEDSSFTMAGKTIK